MSLSGAFSFAELVLDLGNDSQWCPYLTLNCCDGRLEQLAYGIDSHFCMPLYVKCDKCVDFAFILEKKALMVHVSATSVMVVPLRMRTRYDAEVITTDCMVVKTIGEGREISIRYVLLYCLNTMKIRLVKRWQII